MAETGLLLAIPDTADCTTPVSSRYWSTHGCRFPACFKLATFGAVLGQTGIQKNSGCHWLPFACPVLVQFWSSTFTYLLNCNSYWPSKRKYVLAKDQGHSGFTLVCIHWANAGPIWQLPWPNIRSKL